MTSTGHVRLGRRELLRLGGIAGVGATFPGLLTACGGGSAADDAGNRLRVSQTADASTLDPQKQGSMVDTNVLINMFDMLTQRDAKDELVGGLAERWEAVGDTRWRFALRKGVKFHNGEPFDARTVKFSIERLLDPKTKSPIVELRYVDEVKIVDDHTVEIETTRPDPILPEKLSLFGGVMVPPRYIREKGDDHFAERPIGTGPFEFQTWRRDSEIVMKANRRYWNGAPKLDEIVIKAIPAAADAVAALQSGELDVVSQVTPDAAAQLKGDPSLRYVKVPGIRTFYLSLNTLSGGPLAKREVRQALNHAVDVDSLIRTVLGGAAKRTATLIPEQNFGHDPAVQPYPHDVARAKALLAQAGYPNGFELPISAQNSDSDIAQAIAGQLRKAGIKAEAKLLDSGTFEQRLLSDRSESLGPAYFVGNTAWTLDAANNLQSYIKSDRRQSRWRNERANELIDMEEQTIEPAKRKAAIAELQRLLIREAPFVYLYRNDNQYAMNERVDWRPNSIGTLTMRTASIK